MGLTEERNKALVRRVVDEVVNGGRSDVLDDVLAPDFVSHGTGGVDMKTLVRTWRRAFPDWRDTIEDVCAEGDLVTIRVTARGTHEGRLLDIEPTGERCEWGMIEMIRVRDDRFVEQWGYSDFDRVLTDLRNRA